MLYQLSYGTIACCLNKGAVAFCSAKVGDFCQNSKFLLKKLHESRKFAVSLHTLSSRSGCSAVGSALRSGRRGRAFESPHPDQNKNKELNFSSLFLFPKGSSPPQSGIVSVKNRYHLRQKPISSPLQSDIVSVKIRYHLRQKPMSSPSKSGIFSVKNRCYLRQNLYLWHSENIVFFRVLLVMSRQSYLGLCISEAFEHSFYYHLC